MKAQLQELRKIQYFENPDPKFQKSMILYNQIKTLLYGTKEFLPQI